MQQTIAPAPVRDARTAVPAGDYETVRRAIAFISENYQEQPDVDAIAHAAGTEFARAHRTVPALVRTDADRLPRRGHARPRAQTPARIAERARCELRGRPFGRRAAARPVRRPRGDVAGRMEERRRRTDHLLRLPSLAVRHGTASWRRSAACAASPSRTPAKSGRRSTTCARAGRTRATSRTRRRPRRSRSGSSIRRVAAGHAAPRRADRHRFRSAGVGDAARDSARPRDDLFRHRARSSAGRRLRARSAPRSDATRSRSSCRATA